LPAKEHSGNLNIYRVGFQKKRAGLKRYLLEYIVFFWAAFFKVTALYFKRKYKVIHVNTLPDFLVFSAIIPKMFGSKVLLDMHEIAPEFFMVKFNKTRKDFVIKLLLFIEKISLRFASYSLTVTHAIKNIFVNRAIPDTKIEVIMNVPEKTEYKKREYNLRSKFNLVYHGTITSLYSLDIAIKAIAEIKIQIPHICLNIYGEGQEEENLKKLVNALSLQQNVKFHGYLKHDSMMAELNNMDIGVLPIQRNIFIDLSFSNKLAEYVSLGIPVITTEMPSVKDYFKETSLFYFDGSFTKLGAIILEIYNNETILNQKIESAKEDYELINWDIMSERYLKIINKLIDKK
jgi:glycosyltransferase involved in cell wall biosynthesis